MKSLKPRLITAAIGIPLVVFAVVLSELWHPLLSILLWIVTALMIGEYLYGKELLNNLFVTIPCMLFGFGMCMLAGTPYMYILIFALILIEFFVIIIRHEQMAYSDLTYALIGTMIITFGTGSIGYVCQNGLSLSFFFAVTFLLPWMADAGGFFVGATLGKHKLCPKISPKKTVEGAVGGVFFCVAASVGLGFLFQYLITPNLTVHFIPLIIIGACDALLSIVGDLSFSLIKRSINIKDYGSIFPGHGGMLDRFDSIIFTVPMVLIVNTYLPLLSAG
jgi:phosphatidate cytidylyltransferase